MLTVVMVVSSIVQNVVFEGSLATASRQRVCVAGCIARRTALSTMSLHQLAQVRVFIQVEIRKFLNEALRR